MILVKDFLKSLNSRLYFLNKEEKNKILEEYRNKGIGTKLMSYLIAIAIENKVINIHPRMALPLLESGSKRGLIIKLQQWNDSDAIPAPSALFRIVAKQIQLFIRISPILVNLNKGFKIDRLAKETFKSLSCLCCHYS